MGRSVAHVGKRVEPFADRTVADAVHVDLEAGGVEAPRDLFECRQGPVRRTAVLCRRRSLRTVRAAPPCAPPAPHRGRSWRCWRWEVTGGETLASLDQLIDLRGWQARIGRLRRDHLHGQNP